MLWYEDEVERVEAERENLTYEPETIFYGSSSFTNWKSLCTDFEFLKPANFGFGGSTLAACTWFFDRIVGPVKSGKCIIIYAGDNDLGDGRDPKEVCLFYMQLISKIRKSFGDIPCFFISIKPSIQRWQIIDRIISANELIKKEIDADPFQNYINIFDLMINDQGYPKKSLFENDGLHLSAEGYVLWKEVIIKILTEYGYIKSDI
jgi:lysophospholipase L1-like esterase